MNIGTAAEKANLPTKTIRYYEDIGLITPQRDVNGYRVFRDQDVHKLNFVGRARALGFSIEDCRNLLALWEDKGRASADVRAIAKAHLSQIDAKIADLSGMRDTLGDLVRDCAGDARPDCPILSKLETLA
jgi:Cu(I)-responsive transcriptional regulator